MMKLSQAAPYLSLTPAFDYDIELPDITILTGPNGSGKTQFLNALCLPSFLHPMFEQSATTDLIMGINQRPLRIFDEAGERIEEIRHYRINDFFQMPPINTKGAESRYEKQWSDYCTILHHSFDEVRTKSVELNTIKPFVEATLLAPSQADWSSYFPVGTTDVLARKAKVRGRWIAHLREMTANNYNKPGNQKTQDELWMSQRWQTIANEVAKIQGQTGKDILDLKPIDFLLQAATDIRRSLPTSPLSSQLNLYGQLEVIGRMLREQRSRPELDDVQTEAFAQPWDVINGLFSEWSFPFKVQEGTDRGFTLTKDGTQPVEPNLLSSGERILVGLILLICSEQVGLSKMPDLLLIDELDAPLHPARISHLFNVIHYFTEKHQTRTILVTHSPTTVALAPGDRIAVLTHPSGRPPRLELVTKDQALAELTMGVPTLSISHDGRRQVFCESEDDQNIWTTLYENLKGKIIKSDRSLSFIGTGERLPGGDRNTGCSAVKSLVKQLAENRTVFGLVDSDKGENVSDGRVMIVAQGRRDGLENLLLDPLLFAATIVEKLPYHRTSVGIDERVRRRDFPTLSREHLQAVVDRIQSKVLADRSTSNRVEISYNNGLSLMVDTAYLSIDDHILAEKVLNAFPAGAIVKKLQGSKAQTALLKYIAKEIVAEYPEFVPTDLIETLEQLLDEPSI